MADLADDLWCGMNECHSGAKSQHVLAVVPEDGDELEEAVAALNVPPKWTPAQEEEGRQAWQATWEALPQPREVW